MTDILISYRGTDAAHAAGRLVDQLRQSYGADQLVIDVDSVEPGMDFLRELLERIDTCGVLLAIIGKRWLDVRNEGGIRRIDHPLDVVRIEIAYALVHSKR